MTDRADSNTVKTIMDQFLKDEGVRARLRMILKRERNNWEKWLQVELEYFMSQMPGIHVEREVEAFPDNRKLRDRYNMFIDLAFRKKRSRTNSYIFLELKCSKSSQALINGFEKDVKKLLAIKDCLLGTRSFWCVGFHLNCEPNSVNTMHNYVNQWYYGYNKVIKLCDCADEIDCLCTDNKIGFAVI